LAIDWKTQLKPYHEAVVAAIREKDAESVIILGTPSWSQGVDIAAQAPLEGTNLMYTLHFYSCTHNSSLISRAQLARSKGLALFVTEWGATHSDGGTDGKVCLDEAANWMDFLSSASIGWTSWKLDNCPVDSTCLLATDAPITGGWDSAFLHGHALFVRDAMRLSRD
jgi:endoglucanase